MPKYGGYGKVCPAMSRTKRRRQVVIEIIVPYILVATFPLIGQLILF